MAEIALTKQAAAHRLIQSAVHMIEAEQDALAIHVVAASAVNLLRELLAERGPGLVEQTLQYGLWSAAKFRIEGKPTGLPEDEALDAIIDEVVQRIESGVVESHLDLNIKGAPQSERQFLDPILRPFNYLKHAQRDPLATLNETDVKPTYALNIAIAAYHFLFPGETMTADVVAFSQGHRWTNS